MLAPHPPVTLASLEFWNMSAMYLLVPQIFPRLCFSFHLGLSAQKLLLRESPQTTPCKIVTPVIFYPLNLLFFFQTTYFKLTLTLYYLLTCWCEIYRDIDIDRYRYMSHIWEKSKRAHRGRKEGIQGLKSVRPELGLSSPLSFAFVFSEVTAFSARLFRNGSHGK